MTGKLHMLLLVIITFWLLSCTKTVNTQHINYVNPMIGTAGEGRVCPAVSVPFGMIQMGADTRMNGSGYYYDDKAIIGFSHIHKSGGGCNDFLDLRFMPLGDSPGEVATDSFPEQIIQWHFSHDDEIAKPGYYSVKLKESGVKVELTATFHCEMQKYNYSDFGRHGLLVDLKYGSTGGCTIVGEDNYDTVKVAYIEQIDKYTIQGYRVSNGWAPEQHVYFYTQFSVPVDQMEIYSNNQLVKNVGKVTGRDIKSIIHFKSARQKTVMVKTGISAVDMEGAKKNLEAEISGWDFQQVANQAAMLWEQELSKVRIETTDTVKKEIFYTSLFNTLKYPMLYSDVDGRFRGPDFQVHHSATPYYGHVVGLWDTFRAACPLLTIINPEVMNNYVKTFIEFYRIAGQLPVWVLAGGETYQMLGQHSIPVIADCYYKGIRNYDAEEAFEAIKSSAMKDTTGFSMRYFVGLKNYKKYGYVPADLEMESVARTLEYAYNDWNIAAMAQMLGKTEDFEYFSKRAQSYKNVFDPQTKLMRGRMSDGSWRTPFDQFASNHRRDDYCEGNALQWSFFVPHDVAGLASLMGGDSLLVLKTDSLFLYPSNLSGHNVSGDITGLIGQYAHGNEPSHHIAYIYSYLGQPWKTQEMVTTILDSLYHNTPDGICGNEDTGQMSAWYVFSSLGFYPVRHGDGSYIIGTPSFPEVEIDLPEGKQLTLKAKNLSTKNNYLQSVEFNNKPYNKPWFLHNELAKGGEIVFTMGDAPNLYWGSNAKAIQPVNFNAP